MGSYEPQGHDPPSCHTVSIYNVAVISEGGVSVCVLRVARSYFQVLQSQSVVSPHTNPISSSLL